MLSQRCEQYESAETSKEERKKRKTLKLVAGCRQIDTMATE